MNTVILDPLPNLKSVDSPIPEILKEFKICRQTNRQTDTVHRAPFPQSKYYLPRPLLLCGMAGSNNDRNPFEWSEYCCTACDAGFRSVGGLRASLYNAVTMEDVKQLSRFMLDFQLNNTNWRLTDTHTHTHTPTHPQTDVNLNSTFSL